MSSSSARKTREEFEKRNVQWTKELRERSTELELYAIAWLLVCFATSLWRTISLTTTYVMRSVQLYVRANVSAVWWCMKIWWCVDWWWLLVVYIGVFVLRFEQNETPYMYSCSVPYSDRCVHYSKKVYVFSVRRRLYVCLYAHSFICLYESMLMSEYVDA